MTTYDRFPCAGKGRPSENRVRAYTRTARVWLVRLALASIFLSGSAYAQSGSSGGEQEATGEPYPLMPSIAPIGVRIGKYMDVPASAQGPAIDPAKGYRL